MRTYPPIEQRLASRLTKPGLLLCWEWQGPHDGKGYGRLYWNGRLWLAHRVAWVLSGDIIPPRMWVLHRCDNPRCCNPAHLYLGDAKANVRDMWDRNRNFTPRGPQHGRCKLTEDQVRSIRKEAGTYKAIAARYKVGWRAIQKIKKRERWGYLDAPR